MSSGPNYQTAWDIYSPRLGSHISTSVHDNYMMSECRPAISELWGLEFRVGVFTEVSIRPHK